ncbi:MAG: mechanosensitive ion channel family protein [Bacillota bacterium]
MSKQMEKIKEKINALDITILLVRVLLSATMIIYISMGWQQEVYNISMYLDGIIMSLYYLLIASVLMNALKLMIKYIKFKSQRNKTISTLIFSLLRYLIGIVVLILIMIEFLGYSYMTELFAGLGVVALVIGLGCQSLITDIIAGIFMVFEGNYQVGDVVVINGWRGTINSIGLRTMVVEDIGGNQKIINNSSITEIINNSQVLSFALCYVGIEYEESLERVEHIISKKLEGIKENIPEIVEGPFYRGVNALGDSSVELLFVAKCLEDDKFNVQRQLNRQIKLLFDANDINIPYSQITMSYKEVQKKEATKRQKKSAKEFVDSQKNESANFEDQNS